DAAHRLDVIARTPELLAQALDVGVDRARRDLGLDAPDVIEQRAAALHAVLALEQGGQELELEGGEHGLATLDPDAVRLPIDAQAAELVDRRGRLGPAATQHGLDAQEQLADAEGLDHVVIGPKLEAQDAIDLFAFGGEDDNGDAARLGVALDGFGDLGARQ